MEHQLRAAAPADRRALSPGIFARHIVPAGNQVPGRAVPARRLRSAGLSAHRHPRPEGLSRRGDHRPAADRDRREAPVLRHTRQPPSVGAVRGGRHQRAAAQSLRAGRRRRARSARSIRNSATSSISSRRCAVSPPNRDGIERLDPGRRPQHRAARARRLVAQAASQGGQPHAGRDASPSRRCARRATGST